MFKFIFTSITLLIGFTNTVHADSAVEAKLTTKQIQALKCLDAYEFFDLKISLENEKWVFDKGSTDIRFDGRGYTIIYRNRSDVNQQSFNQGLRFTYDALEKKKLPGSAKDACQYYIKCDVSKYGSKIKNHIYRDHVNDVIYESQYSGKEHPFYAVTRIFLTNNSIYHLTFRSDLTHVDQATKDKWVRAFSEAKLVPLKNMVQ
jgi:hypothetical protein